MTSATPEPTLATSQEIREATGIQASKTLTRWHQAGLIPEPTVGTHPNGRGKISYWPWWVVDRCRRIRDLSQAGKSLEEIAQCLGSDWSDDEEQARKRYRFREASRNIDEMRAREMFVTLVTADFAEFNAPSLKAFRLVMARLGDFLFAAETISKVIEGVSEGCNLVLTYDGEDFHIAPDFIVGQQLSDAAFTGQAYVVMPIYRHAAEAFSGVLSDMPPEPTIKPSQSVENTSGRKPIERRFHRVGESDYEIARKISSAEKPRRSGKKKAKRKK